ncbi:hypothetical protein [Bradyrhizobium sp. McL0615]|uniref:hypothetical protein n=1 Tax=Bradyrhizobium sp. McL0615 TaxID=3415673 RepID=UPI003CED36D9
MHGLVLAIPARRLAMNGRTEGRIFLTLAILDAFAQAKRISAPQNQASVPVPPSVTPFFEPICSENFG